jgi:MoaA/NifB/PqqE/SkfB family radical SAM enzyme
MGGEPTLYGGFHKNDSLLRLISGAKELGYEYIRIDTNGLFRRDLLLDKDFQKLDEITFSLDGHTAKINDKVRGKGSFKKCVQNIKEAVKLGYKVDITSCVHRGNIARDTKGDLLLHNLIKFVISLGVNRINFHPVFKMGIPRDTWIGQTDILPEHWINVRNEIMQKVEAGKYIIPVRIPHRFILQKEFQNDPEYYGYCSTKMGERVLIHPNGIIRICALLIGTPYGVAKFDNDGILWNKSITNELHSCEVDRCTPCNNQKKNFGDLVPLCISFKAKQDEFIWEQKLKWESRKLAAI